MKVVIIEEDEISRMSLAGLLCKQRDIEIVDQIGSLLDGYSVLHKKRPDLVIVNLKFLDGIGLDEFSSMMSVYPPARAVFLVDTNVENFAIL